MTQEIVRELVDGVWVTRPKDQTGGGGSQPVRVIGPCTIVYADFNTDGQKIDLFDTAAGDILVDAWYDPATAEDWDDSGTSSILFAETPPGPVRHVTQNFGIFSLGTISPGNLVASDNIGGIATASLDRYLGSQATKVPQETFQGGKYTALNRDGAGDGAAGSIDLYFLVATPTAPVLTP